MNEEKLTELANNRASRREMIRGMAIGGAAIFGANLLAACGGNDGIGEDDELTDVEILQFALNLEYLEAEFYTYATTGDGIAALGIATSGFGKSGVTTGGSQLVFDAELSAILQQVADHERDHVMFLRNALGDSVIAKPEIDFGGAFTDVETFLTTARIFEDVGIGAYAGAASSIQTRSTLDVAARFLAAEALHSGNIRLQVIQRYGSKPSAFAGDIPPSIASYFSITDSQAFSISLTPQEVLTIAGPFFPSGINGEIDPTRIVR